MAKGHVTKKGNRYYVVVDVGRDHRNKRKQKWFSGYKTKKEAEHDLPRVLMQLREGYKEPKNLTVEQYLEDWLEKKRNSVAYGTYDFYRAYVRNHIIPSLGTWKIDKLTTDHVEGFVDEINEKDISQRTKHHIFRILSNALTDGKRHGIDKDIMDGVAAPKINRHEIDYWNEDEVQRFLEHLESKNHDIPFIIALATGMRRGEVLGLRWDRVDFENKRIAVSHQLKLEYNEETGEDEWIISPELKTSRSYRTIDIDDDTIEVLKKHKRQQEKDKMKAGEDYNDMNLVCATSLGNCIKPTYMRRVFKRTIERAGVKAITFHGFRHTHATLLLADGVHAKIVQERLGHESVKTTLDTYSHLIPGIQEIAATSINKAMYKKSKQDDETNIVPFQNNSDNSF